MLQMCSNSLAMDTEPRFKIMVVVVDKGWKVRELMGLERTGVLKLTCRQRNTELCFQEMCNLNVYFSCHGFFKMERLWRSLVVQVDF